LNILDGNSKHNEEIQCKTSAFLAAEWILRNWHNRLPRWCFQHSSPNLIKHFICFVFHFYATLLHENEFCQGCFDKTIRRQVFMSSIFSFFKDVRWK